MKYFILLIISFSVNAEFNDRHINTENSGGTINLSVESNLYNGSQYLNPTVSYTTESDINVGISIKNINIGGGGAQTFEDDTYVNVSKKIRWSKQISTTFSSQTGIGSTPNNGIHLFDYIDTRLKPFDWILFHGGLYYTNKELSLKSNHIGYMTGIGFKLIPGVVHWSADYYSRNSNVSGAVSQITYYPTKDVDLYVGVGVPEKKSGNEFYGLVGFNWRMKL